MTRRERLGLQVVAALAVATGVWYYASTGDDAPTAAGRAPSNRVSTRGGRGDAPLPVADVRLEQLPDGAPGGLDDPSRNPFRFKPKPAPPPPPVAPRPVPQPIAPPVPQGPPPPPPIALRMIGLVDAEKPADRIAIFADSRSPQGLGTPVYGKEGDIIEGRYRVLRVGTDSAELAYLDGRGRQTLRMSGQ